MTTATKDDELIDGTDVTKKDLDQYCADRIEIDDALHAMFFGEMTVRQRMLIDRMGITGQRLDAEKQRVQALKSTERVAGSAEDHTKAVDRDAAADQKLNSAKRTYEPQIAEWERKISEAKQIIADAKAEKMTAAEVRARMDNARRKLMTVLLPESFQSILKILAKPVRDSFKARETQARERMDKNAYPPALNENNPNWSPSARDESKAAYEKIVAEREAAEMQVGPEFRGLYVDRL